MHTERLLDLASIMFLVSDGGALEYLEGKGKPQAEMVSRGIALSAPRGEGVPCAWREHLIGKFIADDWLANDSSA